VIQKTGRTWPVFFALLLSMGTPAGADVTLDRLPAIAIIIDDLGRQEAFGQRAATLPGPVACAFLPMARHTLELARLAHARRKEVLLHLPMESVDQRPLDAGGVTLDMTESQFRARVQESIDDVPYVSGVNNHMGSLLTRHPGAMSWLMSVMKQRGDLYFVDSRTTTQTVALQVAREADLPSTQRNVFLDDDPSNEAIDREFRRLIALARRDGTALAIGHPYPETLAFLEQRLPGLAERGIRLVPVSELIGLQQEEVQTWQASLSRSLRAAKSLKQ